MATATQRLIKKQPECTYCAGIRCSTTRDHAPPITIFNQRDRPSGLEFGACNECHEGTRAMDMVASVFSRMLSFEETSKEDRNEQRKLISNLFRRFPDLASDLDFIEDDQIYAGGRLLGHAVSIEQSDIPVAMDAFAARMGFALYRELAGSPIPPTGAVGVRWYSNYEALDGQLPNDTIALLGALKTLKAGRKDMSSQFTYQVKAADDFSICAFYATFRFSFAFIALAVHDDSLLQPMEPHVYRPGFLEGWQPPPGRGLHLRTLHNAAKGTGLKLRRRRM